MSIVQTVISFTQ